MVHHYECLYNRYTLELGGNRIVEMEGGSFTTDNDDLAKELESSPGYGDKFWKVDDVIVQEKRKPGRPRIHSGARATEV